METNEGHLATLNLIEELSSLNVMLNYQKKKINGPFCNLFIGLELAWN